MKTSFCTIAFQKNKWGQDRVVERALTTILPILARARFQGVEIWQPHIASMSMAELAGIRRQLDELRLSVAMLSPYLDFTTSQQTAEESMVLAVRVLEQARLLRCPSIRVFTGKTGSREATDEQWRRTTQCLQVLGDMSAGDRIVWACETHACNLMDDVDGARKLMRMVNRRTVSLIYQPTTFAAHCHRALELLAPWVHHVHANNYLAPWSAPNGTDASPTIEPAKPVGCALGEGALDYRRIIACLRDLDFPGYISVEWMGDDPEGMARREGAWLNQLIRAG
jgi:sugar phosphate isomerase/epimerase